MKIILVGIYPPPYGGVSSHTGRLLEFLIRKDRDAVLIDISPFDSNHDHVINMSELKTFFFLLFKQKESIVHFHIFSIKLAFLFYLLSFKHLTIITFHNERFVSDIQSYGKTVAALVRYLVNKINRIIVLNNQCKSIAESFFKNSDKIVMIDNYIPPEDCLPIKHKEILAMRKKYKFLISSNAWKITFHQGIDLYGIDLLVELMRRLASEENVGFVLLLPMIGEKKYYLKILNTIKHYQLDNRFLIITEPIDGPAMWKISDLVIRATNTDGSSISIEEALQYGTPVLASNCVERPESVILFKNRDPNDLYIQTKNILNNLERYKKGIRKAVIPNVAQSLLRLYEDIEDSERS
jgi:glycosyltransferase involved in cell wall biosynthesis